MNGNKMILISEEKLKDILDKLCLGTLSIQIIMAQVRENNQFKNTEETEEEPKTMLEKIENTKFNHDSDPSDIEKYHDIYKGIKTYLDTGNLNKAYRYLENNCPLFGYTWCERKNSKYKCGGCDVDCDLKDLEYEEKCEECWRRTLEIEKEALNNGK